MIGQERYKQLQTEIKKEIEAIQTKLLSHERNFERFQEMSYTSDLIHIKNRLKAIRSFMEYD